MKILCTVPFLSYISLLLLRIILKISETKLLKEKSIINCPLSSMILKLKDNSSSMFVGKNEPFFIFIY